MHVHARTTRGHLPIVSLHGPLSSPMEAHEACIAAERDDEHLRTRVHASIRARIGVPRASGNTCRRGRADVHEHVHARISGLLAPPGWTAARTHACTCDYMRCV